MQLLELTFALVLLGAGLMINLLVLLYVILRGLRAFRAPRQQVYAELFPQPLTTATMPAR